MTSYDASIFLHQDTIIRSGAAPAESDPGRRRLSSADPEPAVARHQFPPLDQPPPDDWACRQGTRRVCVRVRLAAVSHQRRHQHRRPGARLSDGPLHLHMIGAGVTRPPGPGMKQHENCEAQRAAPQRRLTSLQAAACAARASDGAARELRGAARRPAAPAHLARGRARRRRAAARRRPVSEGAPTTTCSEGDVFTELMVDQVPPPAESDPGRRRLSSADVEPAVARRQFPPLGQPPPDDWACRQGEFVLVYGSLPSPISGDISTGGRAPGSVTARCTCTSPAPESRGRRRVPGWSSTRTAGRSALPRSAGSPRERLQPAQRERQSKTDEADALKRLVVRRRRPVSEGAPTRPCSEGDVFTELMVGQVPPPAESDPGRRRLSSAYPEPAVARRQFPPRDQPPPDDWACRQGEFVLVYGSLPSPISGDISTGGRAPGSVTARCTCT
ncbi:hypothetical protein FJT64_004092 [Amphibalanus amphitrite]|uniref:Uncharacterized protein n=1 Tax=Amphibalanus amphitrite TaxID=1232801 RepID=A0A6A4VUJ2_AMPAM|nr:hypothetical protein FJT64_004092 [Amphibalanus amphitrite]